MSTTTPVTTTMADIGTTLRLIRFARQLRLEDVAQRAGVSTGHLSKIENGIRHPSLPLIDKLTEVLEVTIQLERASND